MSDTFWEPPAWRIDNFRDRDGAPPLVDPLAADTDLTGFALRPETAEQLRQWWTDRGLEPVALDALLAEPVSVETFRSHLAKTIHRGRSLRHGA